MGTVAPDVALRTGSVVQISQTEHFASEVHSWGCSAVPVKHPLRGEIIGIIDITGGDGEVSSTVLSLQTSTAKAPGVCSPWATLSCVASEEHGDPPPDDYESEELH